MIVKNEAHIILATLQNLCKYFHFDYWVIVDTGSTDNTKQIIYDFFHSKNIKGELHDTPWENFGYNRTDALSKAFNKTDYLLIFDADDEIVGDFILPNELTLDGYHLKFGDNFSYVRLLLVNNKLKWKFVGVLHEYIVCIHENYHCVVDNINGNYFLNSGKSGARSNNPNKYIDDAKLLETAYYDALKKNDDIMVRYSFYCAQSYKDAGNKIKSIEWYKKRIGHGGWNQEVYYSYITIGILYAEMNNMESAFYYWMLSFDADPERCEGIYYIISHLRKERMFKLAFQYYKWIENNKKCNLLDKLFVVEDVYKFLLDYEFTIIAYYVDQHKLATASFHNIFKYAGSFPIHEKENVINNLRYYTDFIDYSIENRTFFYDYVRFVNSVYSIKGCLSTSIIDISNTILNNFKPFLSNCPHIDCPHVDAFCFQINAHHKNKEQNENNIKVSSSNLRRASITLEKLLQKYHYFPNQDFYGSDIYFQNSNSLFDMLLLAENDDNCVCFNTLGYYKNEFNPKKLTTLNCGLYVKKKYHKINININKNEKYKESNKILFYMGYLGFTTPMGGSEKALCYLADAFPKTYDIYICGDVIEKNVGNVHFIHLDSLKHLTENNDFHTVIMSRYIELIVNYNLNCYKLYIWAHDTVIRSLSSQHQDVNAIINYCNDQLDGCVCMTNWHKEYFSDIMYKNLALEFFVINNGIQLKLFPEPQTKIKNTFIYTSRSERGLRRVLELWESISASFPDAHLYIASYNTFPDPNNSDDFILEKEMKKYSNITHMGKLAEKELYDLLNTSEYWLYPTNYFETSCITAMEMLKSRVICLYYPVGGLVDTMNNHGIQLVEGEEVNQIIRLTENEKKEMMVKGEQ